MERLAGSLGLSNIKFLGWLSQQEIERGIGRRVGIGRGPSLWAEPQGLVALEAIVRQVPVIASSAGGLGEIVKHGESGLLFENNDEQGRREAWRRNSASSAMRAGCGGFFQKRSRIVQNPSSPW